MQKNTEISEQTKQIILKLQQNEITEQAIYSNLSKRVKKQSDKEILERIGKEEGMHSKIWSRYTGKELQPKNLRSLYIPYLAYYWDILCYQDNGKGRKRITRII